MTHCAEAPGCQTDARHRNRGPPEPLAGGGEAGGGVRILETLPFQSHHLFVITGVISNSKQCFQMLTVMNQDYVLVFIVAYKILACFLRGPIKSLKKLPTCYMAVAGWS